MHRPDSSPAPHGHTHKGGKHGPGHPHDAAGGPAAALSAEDRLVIRLRHTLTHNQDHVEAYRIMAEEARKLGKEEAARLIEAVAEQTLRQGEDLERALAAVTST